ncbi:hypothetical protein C8Q73DRAFT_742270 [Cubamyces lactineus]|nr:hypothetical protein C8Q73DRAFT_742270 [Cubamyces lactineus]
MLNSCRLSARRLVKTGSKCSKTSYRSYSDKVRAFPFGVSKEKAIADLSLSVSMYTGNEVIGTFLRSVFPSLNLQALRPTRVLPTYIPTWIIDAELEATVWTKKRDTDDHHSKETALVQFGFVFPPLSTLSLMTPNLLNVDTVPWSEDLRKHEGDDVLCLPYSIMPFQLPDLARSLSVPNSNIARVLRLEPSSLKENMLAAYPVLIPVYLAQYSVEELSDDTTHTLSAFIEAGFPGGRSVVEVLPGVETFFKTFNIPVPPLFIRGPHMALIKSFATVRSMIGRNITLQHRMLVERWVNRAMREDTALQAYRDRFFGVSEAEAARKIGTSWSDPRIRPFVKDERAANWQWLQDGSDLYLLRAMLQVYNNKREPAGLGGGRTNTVRARARRHLGQAADRGVGEGARGEKAGVAVRL